MNAVRIFEISNGGFTGTRWLCPGHATERTAKWSVKPGKSVPHDLTCDDCTKREQSAPGYVTPVVPYVKPDPNSRLPEVNQLTKRAA